MHTRDPVHSSWGTAAWIEFLSHSFLDVYWHEKILTWVSHFKPNFAHLRSFSRLRWLSCRRCCQLLQLRKIPWCLSWTRFAAWFCLVGQLKKSQKYAEITYNEQMSKWLLFTTLHPSQACQDQRPYIERWVFRPHSKHERIWKYERISYMHDSFWVWEKSRKFDWFFENFGKCRWHYDFDAELTLDIESSQSCREDKLLRQVLHSSQAQAKQWLQRLPLPQLEKLYDTVQSTLYALYNTYSTVESCWREVWKTWTFVRYLLSTTYTVSQRGADHKHFRDPGP